MSAKPRSDSKLASLNPQQKAQLRTWLVDENKSYEEVQTLLRDDFNVRVGVSAISRFYRTDCFAFRSSEAKHFAAEAVKEVRARENLDEATMLLIEQRAFEQAYARNGDLDALAILAKIIGDSKKLELKRKDQQLAERRIAILEAKAKQADAAKNVTADAALTPAEREAKLKEIFGLK